AAVLAAARQRAEAARDHEQPSHDDPNPLAREALRKAKNSLKAGRFEDARRHLLTALAAGEGNARGLLDQVRDEAANAVLAARKERAKTLRNEGRAFLRRGKRDRAKARFLDALALNPQDSEARQGLISSLGEAPRAVGGTEDANARRRGASLEAGQRHAERARELYVAERDYEQAIDAYFQSLHHYGRADALDPAMPTAGKGTRDLLIEFCSILRKEGEASFAALLLRFYGLNPSQDLRLEPPEDDYLVVEESSGLQIRRAFGGPVRFLPSHRFDALRTWVKKRGKRFQVQIHVKTKIGTERPPRLYAESITIRVEDRQAKTLSAPVKAAFVGGPYQRVVRVDSRGRVVLAWDQSQRLSPAPYAQKLILAAKNQILAKEKAK
ncbi:MAG: hypothetical protein JKY65_21105, partial [Planctomycetes bacterium]|nr:hypothetical protein [Planctomycetota bacterium]